MAINNQLILGGGLYEFSLDTHLLAATIEYAEMVALMLYLLPVISSQLHDDGDEHQATTSRITGKSAPKWYGADWSYYHFPEVLKNGAI